VWPRTALNIGNSFQGSVFDYEKEKHCRFPVPEEFQHKLKQLPALKSAFAALTPGRQGAG